MNFSFYEGTAVQLSIGISAECYDTADATKQKKNNKIKIKIYKADVNEEKMSFSKSKCKANFYLFFSFFNWPVNNPSDTLGISIEMSTLIFQIVSIIWAPLGNNSVVL